MDLLPFFQWCEATAIGTTIRESLWLFPVIEAFHLLGFATIGGAVLLVDLRLLGFLFPKQSVGLLADDAQPFVVGSLLVMFVTGTLLFLSEATKCYYSNPFWIKMTCLVLAIIFTTTIRRRAVRAIDAARVSPVWGKLVAVVSIFLWSGVAWGGRWIGFSG